MAINLGNAFDYFNLNEEAGIPATTVGNNLSKLPVDPGIPITPMRFDNDTNRMTLKDYLLQFGDTAKSGLENFRDQGMSLFDDSRRSNLTRAGLGALLFGFNPITAILGAFAGSKLPGITSAFQGGKFNPLDFIKEKRAEKEAKAAEEAQREFDRLNAIRQQRDADSMSGGLGETTQGTFGSSVNDPSTFSDYS